MQRAGSPDSVTWELGPTRPLFSSISAKDPAGYSVEKMEAVRLSCHLVPAATPGRLVHSSHILLSISSEEMLFP